MKLVNTFLKNLQILRFAEKHCGNESQSQVQRKVRSNRIVLDMQSVKNYLWDATVWCVSPAGLTSGGIIKESSEEQSMKISKNE